MAVIEQSGLMKYKDADGNVYLLYPITNKENVDGLEEIDAHLVDRNNPHGVTWEQLPDKPAALLYEAQELTDDQKTQARTNIGAGTSEEAQQAFHASVIADGTALRCSIFDMTAQMESGTATVVAEQWIHVSDKVPTIDDLKNGFAIVYGDPMPIDGEEGLASGMEGEPIEILPYSLAPDTFNTYVQSIDSNITFVMHGIFVIVSTDNHTVEGITFPKKGVYAIPEGDLTLRINGFNFNEGASSWNDLEDKPFYEEEISYTFGSVVANGDTLTWDGNMDGLTSVEHFRGASSGYYFYLVSKSTPSYEEACNGGNFGANILSEVQPFTAEDVTALEDGFYIYDYIVVVNKAGTSITQSDFTTTFPEAGTYFAANLSSTIITSLTIPGFDFSGTTEIKKLDNKFVDWQTVAETTNTVGGDTLTWDGNTEGLVSCGGAYKVSDIIFESDDIISGTSINFILNDGSIESLDEATVFTSGCYGCYIVDNVVCVAYEEGATISGSDMEFPEIGIYFTKNDAGYVSSLTIPGYTGFETTVTTTTPLPVEYLPSHAHNWSDLGYSPTGGDTLYWDGNTEGLVNFGVTYKISDIILSMTDLANGVILATESTVIDVPSSQIEDGNEYGFPLIFIGEVAMCALEDNVDFEGELIPEKGIYVMDAISSLTIPGYTGFPSVNKVPEKYLPETVATVDYVNDAIQSAINAAMEASY